MAITVANILYCFFQLCAYSRSLTVHRYLRQSGILDAIPMGTDVPAAVNRFIRSGLKFDGVLLLIWVENVASRNSAVELSAIMWIKFWTQINNNSAANTGEKFPEKNA